MHEDDVRSRLAIQTRPVILRVDEEDADVTRNIVPQDRARRVLVTFEEPMHDPKPHEERTDGVEKRVVEIRADEDASIGSRS